jgi:hypothetical protein
MLKRLTSDSNCNGREKYGLCSSQSQLLSEVLSLYTLNILYAYGPKILVRHTVFRFWIPLYTSSFFRMTIDFMAVLIHETNPGHHLQVRYIIKTFFRMLDNELY